MRQGTDVGLEQNNEVDSEARRSPISSECAFIEDLEIRNSDLLGIRYHENPFTELHLEENNNEIPYTQVTLIHFKVISENKNQGLNTGQEVHEWGKSTLHKMVASSLTNFWGSKRKGRKQNATSIQN